MNNSTSSVEDNLKQRFESAAAFVQGYLHPVMANGAYSFCFLTELVSLSFTSQESIIRIVEEIRFLEQGMDSSSKTKPATQFTRRHLKGYWHKHYFTAAFIPTNLRLEMCKDETVQRIWGKLDGQIITQQHIDELVYSLVWENLDTRNSDSRLTGEWIVFSLVDGKRTYLTLARHDECDRAIAERIRHHENVDTQTGWDWRTTRFTLGTDLG